MFVDKSRLKDLKFLEGELKDPTKTARRKMEAHRTRGRILRQLEHPRLARERERLIKAIEAADQHEQAKITNLIKDIMHEEKL